MSGHRCNLPVADRKDTNDYQRLRHARRRHDGFPVGRYLQPAPMLFTRDGHNVFLGDMYRGHTAFLICSGPSLKTHDLSVISKRGVLTMSVNNAATIVRTPLWCSIDNPGNFADVIWRDPGIMKFVPLCHMEKPIVVRDENQNLVTSNMLVGDMPSVFGYRRNEKFNPRQWLYEDTFNWGNHSKQVDEKGNKGSRSVMYVALRLLFFLGIRRVYLVGCDFRMKLGESCYAFDQGRTASSVRGNNSSYRILNDRLAMLQESFAKEGFEVFNCTPNSGLTVFPYVYFDDAVSDATAEFGNEIDTSGMYDRLQRERDANRDSKKRKQSPEQAERDNEPVVRSKRNRKKPQRPQSRPEDQFDQISLLASLEADDPDAVAQILDSWTRFKPGLISRNTIFIPTDADSQLESTLSEYLQGSYRLAPSADPDTALDSFMHTIEDFVQTPWLLFLTSSVEAAANGPPFDPAWLTGNTGTSPVLIGNRIDRVRPASVLRDLDIWAAKTPALCGDPRTLPNREADRGYAVFNGINSHYILAKTDWVRSVCSIVDNDVPTQDVGLYLSYCAQRLNSPMLRIRLESVGFQSRRRRSAVAHRTGAATCSANGTSASTKSGDQAPQTP